MPPIRSRQTRLALFLPLFLLTSPLLHAQTVLPSASDRADQTCPRGSVGSVIPEPRDLRSQNGVLEVHLAFRSVMDVAGHRRYCYATDDGAIAPTLRLHPGDTLILKLRNEWSLTPSDTPGSSVHAMHAQTSQTSASQQDPSRDPCARRAMMAFATNLHFHGMLIPPVCHQDEVMNTSVLPSDPEFEYRIPIPLNQPSGLYWYHPHIHGFSAGQLLGGASGALVVEGIERADKEVAGIRERVLVIRDQDLMHPEAAPSTSDSIVPKIHIDRDGDVQNTGTGTGKPAKDLSINYVPVPYPDYPMATIKMLPGDRQLWRVLNACSVTYLNLQLLFDGKPQMLRMVALDGVPIDTKGPSAIPMALRNHLGIPPGGRVEFIVSAPPEGVRATLVDRTVNTGPGGENDPNRQLANIVTAPDSPELPALSASTSEILQQSRPWLGDVEPVRTRKIFFSEKLEDPNDPNSPTTFYITVEGRTPVPFDPASDIPSIVVKQGDVEDWIIENRSNELHAFHIHQIHFLLLGWNGFQVNEPFLRDTINVPFYDGKSDYPTVRLRMDFRDPNIVGTFLYHCHLLDHEDNGMMALIRVEPAPSHAQPEN